MAAQRAAVRIAIVGDHGVGISLFCRTAVPGALSLAKDAVGDGFALNIRVDDRVICSTLWPVRAPAASSGAQPAKIYGLTLRESQLVGADVVVLCYAVDDASSFASVKGHWRSEARGWPKAPVVLLGMKEDLRHDPRLKPDALVPVHKAERLVGRTGVIAHCLCSSLYAYGLDEALQTAVRYHLLAKEPKSQSFANKLLRQDTRSQQIPVLPKLSLADFAVAIASPPTVTNPKLTFLRSYSGSGAIFFSRGIALIGLNLVNVATGEILRQLRLNSRDSPAQPSAKGSDQHMLAYAPISAEDQIDSDHAVVRVSQTARVVRNIHTGADYPLIDSDARCEFWRGDHGVLLVSSQAYSYYMYANAVKWRTNESTEIPILQTTTHLYVLHNRYMVCLSRRAWVWDTVRRVWVCDKALPCGVQTNHQGWYTLNLDDHHLLLCVHSNNVDTDCAIFAWDPLQEGQPHVTTISFSGLPVPDVEGKVGVKRTQESVRIAPLVNTYFLLLQPRATLVCRLDRVTEQPSIVVVRTLPAFLAVFALDAHLIVAAPAEQLGILQKVDVLSGEVLWSQSIMRPIFAFYSPSLPRLTLVASVLRERRANRSSYLSLLPQELLRYSLRCFCGPPAATEAELPDPDAPQHLFVSAANQVHHFTVT